MTEENEIECCRPRVEYGRKKPASLLISQLVFLLLFLIGVASTTRSYAAIPLSEREVLLEFYSKMNGPNWTDISVPWTGPAGSECSWSQLVCDGDGAHVMILAFAGNNVTGVLPDLSALSELRTFGLNYPSALEGEMPPASFFPRSLRRLVMQGIGATGSIPEFDGAFPLLSQIDLSNNNLLGAIPDFTSLPSLNRIFVKNNHLTGGVPALPASLVYFWASHNELSGALPELRQEFNPNLRYFNVRHNRFSGGIPQLSGAPGIRGYFVDHNDLEGQIPPLESNPVLTVFMAGGNRLSGAIPDLTANIELQVLLLEDNDLSGEIPSLRTLGNLLYMDVSRNALSGPLPLDNSNGALGCFIASDNALSGAVPSIASYPYLRRFKVNDNQLSGELESLNTAQSTQYLEKLYVNGNMMTGSIPKIRGDQIFQQDLRFDDNKFAGELPNFPSTVVSLSVERNLLSGVIPSFDALTGLRKLRIGYNGFSGSLPSAPASLIKGASSICPNAIEFVPSADWDAATGAFPWYLTCDRVFFDGFEPSQAPSPSDDEDDDFATCYPTPDDV